MKKRQHVLCICGLLSPDLIYDINHTNNFPGINIVIYFHAKIFRELSW